MESAIHPGVLFGQLIGYELSSMLAVALAVLAWQSPEQGRRVRAMNAACAAAWSVGGLAHFGLLAAGLAPESRWLAWIDVLIFGSAAVWPVCLLLFWEARPHAVQGFRKARWVLGVAGVTAGLLICALLVATLTQPQQLHSVRQATGYNALVILLGGMWVLRPHLASRAERLAMALIIGGPLLSVTAHWVARYGGVPAGWGLALDVVTKQSIVLTLLGTLGYLARFRASDRFAKLGLRIVFAWALGLVVVWLAYEPQGGGPALRTATDAVAAAVVCAAAACALLLFSWLVQASDRWIDRRVFGHSDPQRLLAELRDQLAGKETEASAFDLTQEFLRASLQVEARVVPAQAEPVSGMHAILVGDAAPFALSVARSAPRMLLGSEVDLIRQTAQLLGRRLEALGRERERIERTRREASLMHQLVDAELRALRAQVNPHFLFNSLNTIAALVHQNPALAESMTLRLARIFRYVLAQTERSFSPLREEIDFLRAYLDIEQMRFGERLQVRFDVAEAVADQPIPSLILQPLVENAIKHGFSPKIGPCRLEVRCTAQEHELQLVVEDDGVGAPSGDSGSPAAGGIGLRNVRERLATVYGPRARFSFESRPRHGSRAAVYLPLRDVPA